MENGELSRIGQIYVLINPAIPGLVKVGKTTRQIDVRIKELSAATGVPSQFLLIYDEWFQNVDLAEIQIHALLDSKGFRHTANREFFHISPSEVIKLICKLPGKLNESPTLNPSIETQEEPIEPPSEETDTPNAKVEPWVSLILEAEKYFYGKEDVLQDYDLAFQNYHLAAKLGCGFACRKLGDLITRNLTVRRYSDSDALTFYNCGVEHGDFGCHLSISLMYFNRRHPENASKCFNAFIEKFELHAQDPTVSKDSLFVLVEYLFEICGKFSFSDLQRSFLKKHTSRIKEAIEHWIYLCDERSELYELPKIQRVKQLLRSLCATRSTPRY